MTMDIKILKKCEVQSNCLGLLPGPYDEDEQNDHSEDSAIFFEEQVFGLIEPVIRKYCKSFDSYGVTEIHRNTWAKIIIEFQNIQKLLKEPYSANEMRHRLGFLFQGSELELKNIVDNKTAFTEMLQQLVFWLKNETMKKEIVSVLGI